MPTRSERILLPLSAAALLVGAWHLALVVAGTKIVPGPLAVLRGLGELAERGVLLGYIGASLGRVGAGYSVAVVLGVPFGLWLGLSAPAGAFFDPLVQILRPISPIAWIPVAILIFGIGEGAPIFLIALASFFPIVAATAAVVRRLPPMYVSAGRNFGLGPVALLARVVFPAALPQILVSLRIALGVAWIVVVAAEMIAVDSGLGYLIIDSRNAGKRYDLVVAGMILVGVIGLGLDRLFRVIARHRAVRWGFR